MLILHLRACCVSLFLKYIINDLYTDFQYFVDHKITALRLTTVLFVKKKTVYFGLKFQVEEIYYAYFLSFKKRRVSDCTAVALEVGILSTYSSS